MPQLQEIEEGISRSFKKIQQAGKFINYFVHDILDFSILRQDGSKFYKNETIFDVREAVQEIIDLQEDKAAMKDITVESQFWGFPDWLQGRNDVPCLNVKTDKKRLQ